MLLITDDGPELWPRVAGALQGGVGHVLLRIGGLSAGGLEEMAARWLPRVRQAAGQLLLHDRVDVALALGVDGVHLPGHGMATATARRLLGKGPVLGRSCHGPGEAAAALAAGADYVTLSPVFATASHPGAAALGLDCFAGWCRQVPGPVLALGGVEPGNLPGVLHAGAHGVAIIRAILGQADPCAAARQVVRLVEQGKKSLEKL